MKNLLLNISLSSPKGSFASLILLFSIALHAQDRFVKSAELPQDTLTLNFRSGWNIFSLNVMPGTADMMAVFSQLIDNGKLVKIQDEVGNALEDYGMLGGWTNNIGDISFTEGYKIKVSGVCQLIITGRRALFPFQVPLKAGWNIAGYPYVSDFNGKEVVSGLIASGRLLKVQDEEGNAIEDFGILGGWLNNIGAFKPGEGYKIKVAAGETLEFPKTPPVLDQLPGITTPEDSPYSALDLDNFVTDAQTPDSRITWSCAGNHSIQADIDPVTHIVMFSAPANWNGFEDITFTVSDEDHDTASCTIRVNFTPVNDPVVFTGTIANIVLNKNTSINIDLKPYFSDVEYTDLQLSYALAGLSLGTYSITDGVLSITGTTAGSETDLRASASDEGTNVNSNFFGLTVNDVVQKSTVTFDFRDASTNTRLTSGTSTLKYKLTGTGAWTQDSTKTSTTGVISLPLLDGRTYEVEIDHSSKLGLYCAFALRRSGDLEPFDQQDAVDKYQAITVTAGGDNIGAYVLMNDFPIVDFLLHAGDGGSRKVNPSNNMTIWWNSNYGASTADQRQWITDIKNQIATIPFVTPTLPFVESTTAQAGVKLEIRVNTNLGNSTTLDANNYITGATTSYPSSPSQSTFKREFYQAFGKTNDSGGTPPFFDTNGNLNTTGKKCFAVSYNFRPKTSF